MIAARRIYLGKIVVQAWLFGTALGTPPGLLIASIASTAPADHMGLGLFVYLLAIPFALVLSLLPCLAGLACVLFFPRSVMRRRARLCLLLPVICLTVWLTIGLVARDTVVLLAPTVVLDAGLAAWWCWRRTKDMSVWNTGDLAATFE